MSEYSYLSTLDTNKINLYSLQLANMKRIEENNVVYIFDEVGSGKTISAGLCTIQLLFHHKDKNKFNNVLVITAPSVVEQFSNKFEDVLQLDVGKKGNYNNKEYQINIINFDYRNIEKACKKYDFIIIDEAHEFLNASTKRHENLIKLSAEKILFLTATPIKHSKKNLELYPRIASKITNSNYDMLKEQILKVCNVKEGLSSGFDPSSPISRYFKETVRNIEKTEDGKEFRDKHPQRLVPELWEYENDKDINSFLADKIEENYNFENKFVIFVRLREHTQKIAEALMEKEYSDYKNKDGSGKKFCIITGATHDRRELLKKFSSTDKNICIPEVLILTYKISEQGIDLPAYNYTINYHIPASPSQLEQRFGRIDRLNSIHNKLSICFLLKKNFDGEINTSNFYIAASTYIIEFLPLLPSKNCLITPEILEKVKQNNDKICDYYSGLLEKSKNTDIVYEIHSAQVNFGGKSKNNTGNYDLISFIEDRNVEFDEDLDLFKKNISEEINNCINQAQKSKTQITWWMENIKELSNDLFYIDTNEETINWRKNYNIKPINPKSVAKEIVGSSTYIKFSNEVKKPIERMRIWNNKKEDIEKKIENEFHNNNFEFLFPENGKYDFIWEQYFSSGQDLVTLENVNEYIGTLPFFKMCQEYKRIVQAYAYNDKGYLYQKYDFNPFFSSISKVFYKKDKININIDFFNIYFDKNGDRIGNPFFIKVDNSIIKSSNWLKLFYNYSRKEAFAIAVLKNCPIDCFKEQVKLHTGNSVGDIKDSFLKIDSIYKEIERVKLTTEKDEFERNIGEYNATFKNDFNCVWSLFNHFLYTMSNKGRECTQDSIKIDHKIYSQKMHDYYLTQEIINDLKPRNYPIL